jgi:hypothetical protein
VWLKLKTRDGLKVACAYHVDRQDFRHGIARTWSEVPWVGLRTWNTRAEIKSRFKSTASERALSQLKFDQQTIGGKTEGEKKAQVWECWDKATKQTVWVSPGVEDFLDKRKALFDVDGFFPCPKPAYGTLKRGTLTPVPDFVYYKDQVEEINDLTARIAGLQESLRIRALYSGGHPEAQEALEQAMRDMDPRAVFKAIPNVSNLSITDLVLWVPIDQITAALETAVALRKQLIDDVYQITGLSDIMRGATEASETATAQRLKSQYGSVRVKERQAEMVRLARDITRMKAEIMAENVEIDDLLVMAQVDDLPREADLMQQAQPIVQQAQAGMMQALQAGDDQAGMQAQQQAQAALDKLKQTVTVEKVGQLFKDQKVRPFVLDIETDSTIEPDQIAEKEQRVEFASAMGPMLQQAMQAMQLAPQLGPFVAESLRFMASGFKVDRRMDEAVDQLSEELANYQPPPQPGQAGEDPEAARMEAEASMVKAQADAEAAKVKAQAEQVKAQAEVQKAPLEAQELATKIELMHAQIQKIMAEIGMQQQKAQTERVMAENDMALATEKAKFEQESARKQFEMDHEDQTARRKMERDKMEHEARAKGALPPAALKRRRTRVTKHDERGRIMEFESTDE